MVWAATCTVGVVALGVLCSPLPAHTGLLLPDAGWLFCHVDAVVIRWCASDQERSLCAAVLAEPLLVPRGQARQASTTLVHALAAPRGVA